MLLKTNPVPKKIPVLIHNGKPICESIAIVQYIDGVWNDKKPILPSDPYQRAHARFWFDYVDKKFFLAGRTMWMTKGEELEAARRDFRECLKVLESELRDKPFFAGEAFGFADMALITYECWFQAYEAYADLSMEEECPGLMEWVRRCKKIESVCHGRPPCC